MCFSRLSTCQFPLLTSNQGIVCHPNPTFGVVCLTCHFSRTPCPMSGKRQQHRLSVNIFFRHGLQRSLPSDFSKCMVAATNYYATTAHIHHRPSHLEGAPSKWPTPHNTINHCSLQISALLGVSTRRLNVLSPPPHVNCTLKKKLCSWTPSQCNLK